MTERAPSSPTEAGPLWLAAIRIALTRQPVAWGAWAALLVVSVGLDMVAHRAGIPGSTPRLTPAFWTYVTIDAIQSAAVTGVALYALIAGRAPPRLDAGYLAFVALMTATDLFWATLVNVGALASADPQASAGRAAGLLVLMVTGAIVACRLALWPIGRLVGDRGMTAAVSWRLMQGRLILYMGTVMLIALPLSVLGLLVVGPLAAAKAPAVVVSLAVRLLDVALTAAFAGLSAAIYVRWIRGRPAGRA